MTPKTASDGQTQKRSSQKNQKKVVAKKRVKAKSLRRLPMIVSQAPPPPEPRARQVTSGALRAFNRRSRSFNRRRFDDAKAMFESVLLNSRATSEIGSPHAMYIQVCNRS